MSNSYDAVIIGGSLSGLASGIRLAMFGKKVVILERHSRLGGLNSYYYRSGRYFDVGLHAMTNFVPRKTKSAPLTKICKQLRLKYDDFDLREQKCSQIKFKNADLSFTNDSNVLDQEIASKFPDQVQGWRELKNYLQNFNEVDLNNTPQSAREVVTKFITDSLLQDMIFFPVLIYGSSWEDDMDFSQFAIMFKSIFWEGFARPAKGVEPLLQLLEKKYLELGGELLLKTEVEKIYSNDDHLNEVSTLHGQIFKCAKIFSSAGAIETAKLCEQWDFSQEDIVPGKLAFVETILVFNQKLPDDYFPYAISFVDRENNYAYRAPSSLIDTSSAVVCSPANFKYQEGESSTGHTLRITQLSSFPEWKKLNPQDYKKAKDLVKQEAIKIVEDHWGKLPLQIIDSDVFTPLTITRYTKRIGGAIYGSETKFRNGITPVSGVYLIGTDQGFLGIVGAMLSGISMANLHGLME